MADSTHLIVVEIGLLVAVLIAAYTDLRWRKIYNWLTGPVFLLGVTLWVVWAGWRGFSLAMIGGLVGFVPFYLLVLLGGMGMGDAKLLGALGALVGWPAILPLLLCVGVAGGVIALGRALWRGRFLRTLSSTAATLWPWRSRKGEPERGGEDRGKDNTGENEEAPPSASGQWLPYGLAIAVGALWFIARNHGIVP